ncbi:hypothetical protein HTZ97_14855 [Desulfuromonas acetoxidans]|uniref:DUF8082 domain-containing protein n=1 Tax=Desulfuromonas acetoxidans (strain DSM 684 / 11070) TaxID=281689 RepID=Q1JZ24_DESA6|nr:hypothetical protein [Desulfuromonas acetoxidans]EAT15470.1 hypothetical protein Dace_1332 [Desulfuromonas acetoxidans DSM 684]MBF0646655.1 hypothetical protein [Desulfuromonas acetoxidans]NVD25758.1 hypothetical protein [Desulfuromonas acetoxidans]NVE17736.1 hypothetical protein [Desulfuromonas acetoxidans]
MEQAIVTLKKLPGVLGVCVYDADLKVMINRMPPFLSEEVLLGLGVQLDEVMSLAREKLSDASEMTLHYDEVALFVHTFADQSILVFGEPSMNGRMVSYSLNMLSKPKIIEDGGSDKVAPPEVAPPQPTDFSGEIPELKQRLAKIIGPMAEIIFDDALDAWKRAGEGSFDSLLEMLRHEIDDAQKYERYLALCAETVERIRQMEQPRG